jgi:glutathione S-transferase
MTTPGERILHLATREAWEDALAVGEYRGSTRGKTIDHVGFIHGSLDHQIADVAEYVYKDCEDELVVLVMDQGDLSQSGLAVRFEDGGNGTFYPHIYAALPCHLVREVLRAWFDDAGKFHFEG